MNGTPAIELRGVSKSYGRLRALRDIDLTLEAGRSLALFGPNGAGKTTLLKIMATISRPNGGKVFVEGRDLGRNLSAVRRRIGLVSHQSFLYRRLDARENLVFYGRMYGVRRPAERAADLLDQVGLGDAAHRPVGGYSRGMIQRLAIARALIHDPSILLLDEPYTGLDPQAIRSLTRILAALSAEGRTLVMVSHDLRRGLSVCGQAALLEQGVLHPPQSAAGEAEKERLAGELLERLEGPAV